jgi:ribosomal protein S18 acetylase RimI-like enzyme
VNIRHADLSDLNRLAEIEAESYPPAEGASRKSLEGRLQAYPDHFWLLETDDGQVAAFVNGFATMQRDLTDAMYDHPEMHDQSGDWQMIFSLVTAPEYRRQGYAGLLLQQVIADARRTGRKGIVLTCKDRLIPYYAKFGFENEGVSGSVHGHAVWYQMRRTL